MHINRYALTQILAAMLPAGNEERNALLVSLGETGDECDHDGGLYRISSDDVELNVWADVARKALREPEGGLPADPAGLLDTIDYTASVEHVDEIIDRINALPKEIRVDAFKRYVEGHIDAGEPGFAGEICRSYDLIDHE